MTPSQAAKILGFVSTEGLRILKTEVIDGLSKDQIRAMFSAKLQEAHSDTGGEGHPETIRQLQRARDVLVKNAELHSALEDCPKCNGSGRMKTRSGLSIKCSTCAGDGEIRRKEFARG